MFIICVSIHAFFELCGSFFVFPLSTKMDFQKLKQCSVVNSKTFTKLVSLKIGQKYRVLSVARKQTSFGKVSIMAELEENLNVWLPQRYEKAFTDAAVDDFNANFSGKMYLEVLEIKSIMGKDSAIINIDKY